jgi:hypothetical protein
MTRSQQKVAWYVAHSLPVVECHVPLLRWQHTGLYTFFSLQQNVLDMNPQPGGGSGS